MTFYFRQQLREVLSRLSCIDEMYCIILQSEGPRPVMVSRSRSGFTLNIIDTPGLIEGGYVNDQALEIIKRFVSAIHDFKVTIRCHFLYSANLYYL